MKLRNTETYRSADDRDAMFREKGKEKGEVLTKEKKEYSIALLNQVEFQFPKCHKRLKELYGHSRDYLFLASRRFSKCNCGNYDHILDIDSTGYIHVEFITCPMRGECLDEGVICMPEIETGLTPTEKEVLKLLSIGKQNQEIASELFISIETVKSHIQNMMRKLELPNRAALASFATKINI